MKQANISIFVPHVGCPNQCSFCNQKHISGQEVPPTAEDAAKTCESALAQDKDHSNSEIAFFGGSFTAIEHGYMCSLLKAVQPYIGSGKFKGIRVSTRPDAISRDILELLLAYHVTSIELGVQSMDNTVLKKNRRGHTAEQVREAVALIRSYPFELGLQFMPGLYADTAETMEYTAEEIIKLHPDTVRIYPTLVLANTELAELYRRGKYKPLTVDEAVNFSARWITEFEDKGIRVIRVGLHASTGMEKQLIAGPYHQAFRELCESRIFYDKALALLKDLDKNKKYHLLCPKNAISKVSGQGGENLKKLRQLGYDVKVKPLDSLIGRELTIEEFIKRKGKDVDSSAAEKFTDTGI